MVYKCFYDDDVTVIRTKGKVSLNRLRRKIQAEYKSDLAIKFKDDDGDTMPITRLPHLKAAVKEANGKPVRLYLSDAARNATLGLASSKLTRSNFCINLMKNSPYNTDETILLENLVDGCIIINKRGNIIFFNEAAEELFGYRKKQVLGHNVKLLMPTATAENHDNYIKSYLHSGEGSVMGSGRVVIAKRRDKTTFPIHLSISDCQIDSGEYDHCFVGIVKDVSHLHASVKGNDCLPFLLLIDSSDSFTEAATSHSDFSLLDGILDCAIVCDQSGTVEFFNKSAEQLLGYSRSEVVGRNVKMLMPSPFHEEHDSYLKNYLTTGVRKVLGTGRDVIAQRKDGTLIFLFSFSFSFSFSAVLQS